jgi:hypothetical protein
MPEIPAAPARLVQFTKENFPYTQGQLERIMRAYAAEIGVEPMTEFYLGVEDAQCDFGIFRTVETQNGIVRVQYEKSFPHGSFSALPERRKCVSTGNGARCLESLLASYEQRPEEALARMKDAFVRGPTTETLTQRIDNGRGQDFDATIIRPVTKPFVENGLQFFRYHLSVPVVDILAYRDRLKKSTHSFARQIVRRLPTHPDGAQRAWCMVEQEIHVLTDVIDFLRLNQEFYQA